MVRWSKVFVGKEALSLLSRGKEMRLLQKFLVEKVCSKGHLLMVWFHALQLGDEISKFLNGIHLFGQVFTLKEVLELKNN